MVLTNLQELLDLQELLELTIHIKNKAMER